MPSNDAFSVADPRYTGQEYSQYGVLNFDAPMGAVSGQSKPGGGKYTVADPRFPEERHKNVFRVVPFQQQTQGNISDCCTDRDRHGGEKVDQV